MYVNRFVGVSMNPNYRQRPWMKRVSAIFFPVLQTRGLILWASWVNRKLRLSDPGAAQARSNSGKTACREHPCYGVCEAVRFSGQAGF